MQLQDIFPGFNYPPDLPIINSRAAIVSAIVNNPVVVITGQTGCGKTTQLPLFCLEALGTHARIAVTQPRRIAAVSIARRVSRNLCLPLGDLVGFRTRFDECVSGRTRILFQTDGIMVSEIGRDRYLGNYDAIIIDEAHERNLNIDLVIGHLCGLIKKRRDLKIIISSATINPGLFSRAFDNAPMIHVEGRTFPISIIHDFLNVNKTDYVQASVDAVEKINQTGENGDILIFMPTERDILAVKRKLDAMKHFFPTVVLPLFARLSRAHQELIFRSMPKRKIVIATNIAETSVTVPGICFVIDSGLARIKRFQHSSRITALPIERISRASADQRAGRCGRTQEGVCIRLYSRDDYAAMDEFTPAEILRCNMAGVILLMAARRLGGIENFAFLEAPPVKSVKDGFKHLIELGAMDEHGRLTEIGTEMSTYPLDPHLARIIVAAKKQGALAEALIIVSALSCMDPRDRPLDKTDAADQAHKRFGDPVSDFIWYLNVWRAYHDTWNKLKSQSRMRAFCQDNFLSFMRIKEWRDVHSQLSSIIGNKTTSCSGTYETIHKSLLAGLIANLAIYKDETKTYRMSHGGAGLIFPGSMLTKKCPPWVMFAEKTETSRLFLRTVSQIDPEWISEIAPHLVKRRYSEPYFDEEAGTVRATEHKLVFGLVIGKSNVAYQRINPGEANDIFIREGLIENRLQTHYGFIKHNMAVCREIEIMEAKLRVKDLYSGDSALIAWYKQHIPNVTSIHDLNKAVHSNNGDAFLKIAVNALLTSALPPQITLWPDFVNIGGEEFPCTYLCDPCNPFDGVTVHLPPAAREFITAETLSWPIKPQWERRIEALLEAMPREAKKNMMPLQSAAAKLASMMKPDHRHFCMALSQIAKKEFDANLPFDLLANADIPAYLTFHVLFDDKRPEAAKSIARWQSAIACLGQKSIEAWNFGDIPEYMSITKADDGIPLFRFPALCDNGKSIDLIACATFLQAESFHKNGISGLTKKELAKEFAWIGTNNKIDRLDRLAISSIGDPDMLLEKAINAITEEFGVPADPYCRSAGQFQKHLDIARQQIPTALRTIVNTLSESGKLCAKIAGNLSILKKSLIGVNLQNAFRYLVSDLKGYIVLIASDEADYTFMCTFSRYLKRLDITVQRAKNAPLRYLQRMDEILRYEKKLQSSQNAPVSIRRECRRMLEEYKISVFAQQEVKAAPGTSEKKIIELFEKL
jgi:ATP-dependent helicase HrpA